MLYVDEIAPTEEEAIQQALRRMRLERSEISVESVTEVDGGIKVRVKAAKSRGKEANELLEAVLSRIGIPAELFYIESYDKILINVKGPHLGLIIGKGGSTLEALEILLCAMHNRGYSCYKPIVINPGGYRENKRKALWTLVKKAVDAAGNGDKVSLPVMRQRDRKQVHQIIKEFPGFRSRSLGDEKDRRVVIFQSTSDESDSGNGESEENEADFLPGESGLLDDYNQSTAML
jgi:spoIIIJ-associated protein